MVALWVSLAVFVADGRRRGAPFGSLLDVGARVAAVAFLGALAESWLRGEPQTRPHLLGALLAGALAAPWLAPRYGLARSTLFDAAGPAFLIGIAIVRVGCWQAGCCGGVIPGVPLLEAGLSLAAGCLLALARNPVPGTTALLAVGSYALIRLAVDWLRGGPWWGLSEMQWVALLVLGGLAWLAFPKPRDADSRG
ncbi:MAG: prolipoprotein diacylglyceryl transferase [Armatimonadetes bacterium]|nr:prolipoprotein diacylglyceryl transferase [Armatimonadota bacterium]